MCRVGGEVAQRLHAVVDAFDCAPRQKASGDEACADRQQKAAEDPGVNGLDRLMQRRVREQRADRD